MTGIIENVRSELMRNADEKTKQSGERFFKEEIKLYGIKSALVSNIGKEHYKKIKDKDKSAIFSLCDELWKSGMMEETFIACNWSYNVRKQYKPSDFEIFERWVNIYIKTGHLVILSVTTLWELLLRCIPII